MSAITLLLIGQSLYNKINIQTSVLPFSTWVRSLGWKIPWRRERLPTSVFGLENSLDYIIRGVAKSQTRLSGFNFTSLQAEKPREEHTEIHSNQTDKK